MVRPLAVRLQAPTIRARRGSPDVPEPSNGDAAGHKAMAGPAFAEPRASFRASKPF